MCHVPLGIEQILNFRKPDRELTDPVAVVADFDDEVILPQVPDGRPPAGTGRSKNVLHLAVPCHTANVLQRLTHKNSNKHNLNHYQQTT